VTAAITREDVVKLTVLHQKRQDGDYFCDAGDFAAESRAAAGLSVTSRSPYAMAP